MSIENFLTSKRGNRAEMWRKLAAVLTSTKTMEQMLASERYAHLWYRQMKHGLSFGQSFKLWLDVRDMLQEMQLRVEG